MADKKNNDSLFQWNFNLEDSDSDFTDIDFSSNSGNEASDKDIQPIIFVRDETGKKKTEEKRPQAAVPASAGTKKTQPAAKRPAAKKPAAKRKSSGPALNWKLIAVIAAAILVIALVVVLLGRCGKKEEKAWTKVEADSKIRTLMDGYFAAKKDGDAMAMRKVLVEDYIVNASVLAVEAAIYGDYTDISLQQYPGIKKNETVVCAAYDTYLSMIKASVPTISWFYAQPDSANNLRLLPVTQALKESNETVYNYVSAASALLADTTVAEVKQRHNNALASNEVLRLYLENLAEGNYYDIPSIAESTEAPGPDQTEPESTEEQPGTAEASNQMFVKADTLRMRRTPTTNEDNIIWNLPRGYCVTVLSIENGWAHIRDDVQTNPSSGAAQKITGAEGYVSADYLVSDYSTIQW